MGRFNLTRSVLVAVSLASVLGTSLASAQAPDGPAVTDGSYTITYVPAPNANVSGLQEKIGSAGTWQNVPDSDHDGSVSFTNKPDGTFYYRKWDFITGSSLDDMETIYSAATKVIVTNGPIPTADSLSEQLRYTYATRIGDINSDGRKDIYLYRTSGGVAGNGTVNKIILRQLSGGKFTAIVPTASQVSTATAWQSAHIPLALEDVNVDGFVDVGLSDISSRIPGALDQILYAPAQILNYQPKGLTNITTVGKSSFQRFFNEFTAWVEDPQYYEDNKIWVEEPGRWERRLECDWYYWGDVLERYCYYVDVWVDGDEYWSYEHFNQSGLDLAKAISDVLSGNYGRLPAAIDILEQVLGVEIGGWDFGDWLPGPVSNDQQFTYSLVLSIVSTRDVRNNQTPTCISQDLQYYQDRLDAYIEPADFVQVMNNSIQGNENWAADRYVYLSGPGVYLREIEDFGFFDAKHAKTAYKIGHPGLLALLELAFEQFLQGCQSSNITEDIFSNYIGMRARELYSEDPSRTAGRYIRDLISQYGTLETRGAARGLLNAAGIPVQ